MNRIHTLWAGVIAIGSISAAAADVKAGRTTVLGPFTGHYAPLHPDNLAPHRIAYYGTDLGWTYEHAGKLQILFGDTAATEKGELIEASSKMVYDDGFGTIDLKEWPDPSRITSTRIPLIRLGQNPGTTEMSAINPGHAMESFKTPLAGFSNGRREFGIFYSSKQQGCSSNAPCSNGFVCDTGLGFIAERYDTDKGQTIACVDGSPLCNSDTMLAPDGKPLAGSGFCIDPSSSVWAKSDVGRISSVVVKNLVGLRSESDPRLYTDTRKWFTSKFSNPAVRTEGAGASQRVLIWGRPGFIGVGARGRSLAMYYAYADMPAGPAFEWNVHYYTGTDPKGVPQYSRSEKDAAAVDLDSTREGIQSEEVYDIVDQMSIAWVEPLEKWVMFYGGGMIKLTSPLLPNCGVLEIFTRAECKDVVVGNGAIRMRSADNPWGPWSPPQDILVGGDPDKRPLEGQFAPGGILRHPDCVGSTCATPTNWEGVNPREYGFLYGANIIEQWIRPAGDGVDILWNASTWTPYRVVLLRTRINR
jgi:hypothetical protein